METLKNADRAENPYNRSNWISKLFFWHLNGILSTGYKRLLTKSDILKINKDDSTQVLCEQFEKIWEYQLKNSHKDSKAIFFISLFKFKKYPLILVGIFTLVFTAAIISQSVFLKELLTIVAGPNFGYDNNAYYWAASLAAAMLIQWLISHLVGFQVERLGVNITTVTSGLIYKKVLRLGQRRLGQITTGHIVTLVSSDAHKLQELFRFFNYLWLAPLMVIAVTVILWRELGPSCLAGVGVLIITLPVQSWFGKFFAYIRFKTVLRTDERINIMNEVVSSMQVTKMYTWEDSFSNMIKSIRKKETNGIMKTSVVKAINNSLLGISPYLVTFSTFTVYYFHGNVMTLPKAFLTMSLFYAIRLGVVLFFPLGIQFLAEAYVSCKRIQAFLLTEEVSQLPVQEKKTKKTAAYVNFQNVSAAWDKDSDECVLNDITFKADEKNSLLMLVGPVGCGKSSILMAILNELSVKQGQIDVSGSIAYSVQQAWIFSGTIQQNILFGKAYDKKFYHKVVSSCALLCDFASFEKGDLTLVGEKGVTLSGGQKARISLARAVYHDADIYLLDDPLSAVDTKVGKHIFERCIQGLLKKKVVILVTHQIQYLQYSTGIVCLKEDASPIRGSLHDLSQQGADLVSLLHPETREKQWDHDSAIDTDDHMQLGEIKTRALSGISLSEVKTRTLSGISLSKVKTRTLSGISLFKKNKSVENLNRIVASVESLHTLVDQEEEEIARGTVPISVYTKYAFQGVGCFSVFALIAVLVLGQVCLTLTDYWFAEWSKGEEKRLSNITFTSKYHFKENPDHNLYLFAGLVGLGWALYLFRAMYFFIMMVICSRRLHNKMFTSVLKAPNYFFDTNPVGQILNRFSRDVYLLDHELPWSFFDFVRFGLLTLAIIILNCISVPYMVIIVIPLFIIFYYVRNYYLKSSREIKRLEAVSRSPLYTHLSATLAGITTIRSFNLQETVLKEFYACQDYQAEAFLTFLFCARWFAQRIDFIALTFSICSLFAPVVTAKYIYIDAGLVGVSLTYALFLCGMFQWCVRQSAEVDNLMTSAERIFEYAELKPEPDYGRSKGLRETWPEYGLITAEAASFAYHSTLPYVLKKLYFCIRANEKVGIVGRTGAGKSSLLSMFFRMGVCSGTVRIDGYPTHELRLKDLRRSISVIPQDPVMFTGTLRRNLDPFQEYTDADIWEALEEVQMKETVLELQNKLDTEIAESGSNCSVGERQLLCLARAILKKNKILVIDEATANVDYETDSLIQRTIREKFKDCTVLTVAHRLNTVMDSDRVMVMEGGKIVEFDEPFELLQNPSGYFRKLVDQAGHNEASRLEVLAEEAKHLRHVMLLQSQKAYPGSQITISKSKNEIIDYFDTRVIYETTL